MTKRSDEGAGGVGFVVRGEGVADRVAGASRSQREGAALARYRAYQRRWRVDVPSSSCAGVWAEAYVRRMRVLDRRPPISITVAGNLHDVAEFVCWHPEEGNS